MSTPKPRPRSRTRPPSFARREPARESSDRSNRADAGPEFRGPFAVIDPNGPLDDLTSTEIWNLLALLHDD